MESRTSNRFSEILHQVIVVEDKYSVKKLAYELDMREDALYKRMRGETSFTLEQAIKIIKLVPDINLISSLIEGTQFHVVPARDKTPVNESKNLVHWAISAVSYCGSLLKRLDEAMEDNVITAEEKKGIEICLD